MISTFNAQFNMNSNWYTKASSLYKKPSQLTVDAITNCIKTLHLRADNGMKMKPAMKLLPLINDRNFTDQKIPLYIINLK